MVHHSIICFCCGCVWYSTGRDSGSRFDLYCCSRSSESQQSRPKRMYAAPAGSHPRLCRRLFTSALLFPLLLLILPTQHCFFMMMMMLYDDGDTVRYAYSQIETTCCVRVCRIRIPVLQRRRPVSIISGRQCVGELHSQRSRGTPLRLEPHTGMHTYSLIALTRWWTCFRNTSGPRRCINHDEIFSKASGWVSSVLQEEVAGINFVGRHLLLCIQTGRSKQILFFLRTHAIRLLASYTCTHSWSIWQNLCLATSALLLLLLLRLGKPHS